MDKQWTDLDTWMLDNSDERIFRVWKYKKVFTPLEQDKKYIDQSMFEDERAKFCWLDEVIEMGGRRFMFGFRHAELALMHAHGDLNSPAPIIYMMDGEFTMEYYENDLKKLLEELGYDDDDGGEEGETE